MDGCRQHQYQEHRRSHLTVVPLFVLVLSGALPAVHENRGIHLLFDNRSTFVKRAACV